MSDNKVFKLIELTGTSPTSVEEAHITHQCRGGCQCCPGQSVKIGTQHALV